MFLGYQFQVFIQYSCYLHDISQVPRNKVFFGNTKMYISMYESKASDARSITRPLCQHAPLQ